MRASSTAASSRSAESIDSNSCKRLVEQVEEEVAIRRIQGASGFRALDSWVAGLGRAWMCLQRYNVSDVPPFAIFAQAELPQQMLPVPAAFPPAHALASDAG